MNVKQSRMLFAVLGALTIFLGLPAQASTYVLSTFMGDASAQEKLWIYTSPDGVNFTQYSNTGYGGPTGVLRDPTIMKYSDGKYYIAFTTQSWTTASTFFAVASSPDLIHWTTVATVPSGVPNTHFTWAPEWYIEGTTYRLLVAIDDSGNGSNFKIYSYTAQNTSFTSWSGPTYTGLGNNHIDPFVVKIGDTYHALCAGSEPYMDLATAPSLFGPWTWIGTGNWAGWGTGYEGPAMVLMDDGTWRTYADQLGGHGIMTGTADANLDMSSFSGFSPIVQTPAGDVLRHGTVWRQPPLAAGTYTLVNRADGNCLDNLGSTVNGAGVAQETQSGSLNQRYVLSYAGGYATLMCVTGNEYLDSVGHGGNGSTVGQWQSSGNSNQQWTITDLGNGYYKVINRTNGLCLDTGGNTANGSIMQFWGSGSSFNQQWQFVVSLTPPTGLAAIANDSQVELSWSAAFNATSYNVKRATTSDGPFTTIANPTGTSYTDAGLTDGTTYYYVVSSINGAGESANSSEVFAKPLSAYQQYLVSNNLSTATADSAEPDGDGVPLLLKYATAMTPGTPSAAGPAAISSANNYLILQFNRTNPATVNYLVEASSDLVNWTTVASLASGATSWTGPAGVSESATNPIAVTVTDSVPFSPTTPRFLRLRVTTATDTTVSGTVPQGDVPITLASAATSASSLTLDNIPVARNAIQTVTTNTVTVVNAGTWATTAAPYAVRLLSGNASGATFTITAQTGNILTLATQGVDLTQIVAPGDTYEILPLETLGSLFGTSSVPFQTGTSASTADNIELWSGTGWLIYYPNGTNWRQAGSLVPQNNVLLPPGAGWLTLHRGTSPLTFYILGRVPEVPLRQFITPGGSTFLAGASPFNSPLASTGFATATGWLAGGSASVADNLELWSGSGWLTFYYNGTNWKQSGSLLNQNTYVVPANDPLFVVRLSSPSPTQSFVIQPLPYTP